MLDPQLFTDRMLESENLTDALDDEAADYLLNWGVARLRAQLARIEDAEAAGEYTNRLMALMRCINRISGNLEGLQEAELVRLVECRQASFGPGPELTPEDYAEAFTRLKTMTQQQAIDFLLPYLLPE